MYQHIYVPFIFNIVSLFYKIRSSHWFIICNKILGNDQNEDTRLKINFYTQERYIIVN